MSRLYLAGPISGMPDHNKPAFRRAAEQLRAAGYDVLSPIELGRLPGDDFRDTAEDANEQLWGAYLRRDLLALLDAEGVGRGVTAVAVLPGWEGSRGAALEVHVARELGMPVRPVDDWLGRGD